MFRKHTIPTNQQKDNQVGKNRQSVQIDTRRKLFAVCKTNKGLMSIIYKRL